MCHLNLIETMGRYGVDRIRTLHLKWNEPIINFSKNGKWFGVVNNDESEVSVYDSTNILKLFDDIKDSKDPYLKIMFPKEYKIGKTKVN